MLDPGVLPVGVLPGVTVSGVLGNPVWNLLRNEAANAVEEQAEVAGAARKSPTRDPPIKISSGQS